jgi:hypothetical protein
VAVRGGGCLALGFGLPMLALGLSGVWFALGGSGNVWGSGSLALAGLLAIFGRKAITVDGQRPTLNVVWGVFGVGKTRRTPLGDPQEVVVTSEIRGDFKHRYSVYPVRVVRRCEAAAVIDEPDDSLEARRVGEVVAKALRCRLANQVDGTIREVQDLDRTVRDTLREQGGPIQVPEREPSFCTQYQQQDGADVITLPRVGFAFGVSSFVLVGVLMSLGFGIAFGIEAQSNRHISMGVVALGVGMPMLMFSLPAALVAAGRQVITVSSREMKIETEDFRGISGFTIPASELEELVSGTHDLTAISDRLRVSFGHRRLTASEVAWLRAVIERAIAA